MSRATECGDRNWRNGAECVLPEGHPGWHGNLTNSSWPDEEEDIAEIYGFGQGEPVQTDAPSAHDLVIADMRQRKAFGLAKYGTILQHDNGRDHLQDAYEEVLDLAVYLRNEIEQRRTAAGDQAPKHCNKIALDGERCLRSPGHDGRCYSRMATPENVAKCLRQMPDGSKCQLKMNHDMPHISNTSEELS
ncbi:hypothetical protein SEA_EMIANNA_5 [Gordonia phage Emianna]|uniref:Uncharacterized protein n=2 Tax=Foxborovirus TaxID=2948710 RepID=A0A385UCJ6_9CAUD|nr:hypothetical protein KNU10_gp05 [Gordonia phage Foxboro]YP_010098893.1 hypothetical protein KNU15_gp05 [Gordonia phage Emianna]AYB69188.1 hypothetical protein SEA_FOXBORO_5 [Gordonia phage Foxboro]AYD83390.1 hypothetical protein SEA_EMIANNA_5 [Gordonia phage Emianna]AYD84277.1 hypothetical protein SEA_KURT_5 [Gordonia phage Kurt]